MVTKKERAKDKRKKLEGFQKAMGEDRVNDIRIAVSKTPGSKDFKDGDDAHQLWFKHFDALRMRGVRAAERKSEEEGRLLTNEERGIIIEQARALIPEGPTSTELADYPTFNPGWNPPVETFEDWYAFKAGVEGHGNQGSTQPSSSSSSGGGGSGGGGGSAPSKKKKGQKKGGARAVKEEKPEPSKKKGQKKGGARAVKEEKPEPCKKKKGQKKGGARAVKEEKPESAKGVSVPGRVAKRGRGGACDSPAHPWRTDKKPKREHTNTMGNMDKMGKMDMKHPAAALTQEADFEQFERLEWGGTPLLDESVLLEDSVWLDESVLLEDSEAQSETQEVPFVPADSTLESWLQTADPQPFLREGAQLSTITSPTEPSPSLTDLPTFFGPEGEGEVWASSSPSPPCPSTSPPPTTATLPVADSELGGEHSDSEPLLMPLHLPQSVMMMSSERILAAPMGAVVVAPHEQQLVIQEQQQQQQQSYRQQQVFKAWTLEALPLSMVLAFLDACGDDRHEA